MEWLLRTPMAERTIFTSTDPHKYFRKALEYEYLGSEHLKGVSFKRSELVGIRGVRQLFGTCTKFNWKGARTEEQLEE
jgi:hypothetical protein